MLVGNMDQEGGLFPSIMKAGLKGFGKAEGGGTQFLVDSLLFLGEMMSKSNGSAGDGLERIGCGSGDAAVAREKHKVPVWRYRFFGEWPNLVIWPGAGAYHSQDCPIVFGVTERNLRKIPDTPEEAKFVKNVMTAWATFAKDPENGLTKLGWPQYKSGRRCPC